MVDKRRLGGLDCFRIVAAILVVAIHTSPLLCVGGDADFFLTRVLARVAVPFFFMVTGHFTVSRIADSGEPGKELWRYLKKMLLLYLAAVLLYLPIGIYAGHYEGLGLPGWLRLLIFDGSFYHLWYFPACMIGVPLTVCLVRKRNPYLLFAICGVLYAVGLFGDSYYGLSAGVPAVKGFYDALFPVFSYTRNGLFFAPLFLALGTTAGRGRPARTPAAILGLTGSLLLMTAEAFLLRHFGLPRHDSMYVMLVPAMWFLYRLLLNLRWKPAPRARRLAMWVYLLHPAVIVAVRGLGTLTGWRSWMADQSLVHFLLVCAGSFAAAFVISAVIPGLPERERPDCQSRAWIGLNRDALAHNVAYLQQKLPANCALMPAVKANAYGHGAVLITKELEELGVRSFCVACVSEGIELRRAGVQGEILILGYTAPEQFRQLRKYRLTQIAVDFSYAQELNSCGKKLRVHIGVDTGMHRLGERCENFENICRIFEMKHLVVEGLCTHLATPDSRDDAGEQLLYWQISSFRQLTAALNQRGYCPKLHALASYGVLRFPELAGDWARVGIALYGTLSTGADTDRWGSELLPVLSLKARVAAVKPLCAGESAGYGAAFTSERDMKIAVVAIGYADGLPPELSNGKGKLLIRGRCAPIVGRICMDQTIVDVSGIPGVTPGDIAVIIGRSGAERISAGALADVSGISANELLSRLGARPERMWE